MMQGPPLAACLLLLVSFDSSDLLDGLSDACTSLACGNKQGGSRSCEEEGPFVKQRAGGEGQANALYVVASSKNGHRLIRVLQCLVPDTF